MRDGSSSNYRISTTCTRSNIWGNRTRISNLSGSSYTTGTCHDYNPLYADIDSRNYAPTIHSPNRKLGPDDGEIGSLPFEGAPGPQIMGYLWDDITFTAEDSPYDVLGDLVVPNGTTVTFEPGAELRIVPNDDGMEGGDSGETEIVFEDGAVGVFESGDAPIVFTPDRDDPAPNDWQGFRFKNGQTTTINNTNIEYANIGVAITGPTAPKIQDSLILYSQSAGVTAVDVTTEPLVDVLTTRIVGRGAGTGVQFSHSGGMVRSSYITHHSTGILASLSKTRTVNLHFINNTIVHQATGIQYGRSSSFSYNMVVNAWNNVIAESTSNAIRDTSSSNYSVNDTVRNNNFFNRTNTSGAFNSNVGNITSDPLIEDDDWESFPRWFDGKLWSESLAINEGNASAPNLPATDLAGNPRNLAGGVDIGAYEFDPDANREPRADAVETAIMVPRGESFEVDGTAAVDPDGFIASAFWTFIDGTVLPGLVVTHTLEQEGTNQWGYLTVIDDDGAEDHALVDINVNIRPVADAGPNVFQDEGPDESVFFDGTLSADPDGTIVSWVWDFGDGTPPTSEASPRHSYLSAGLYTVTLTVTDNEGLTDTDVTIATVFGNNDTVGPLIQHNEIADGQPLGDPVVVRATIQDPSNVTSALLFHRAIGAQGAQFAVMTDLGNNLWEATIPGGAVTADGVEYWISAADGVAPNNNSSTSPVGAPDGGVFDFLVVGDPDPPSIQHTPIEDGQAVGEAVTVTTTITDATGVGSANIYFRPIGGQSFGARSMANINGDTWTAQIPAFLVTAPGVEYYFDATDTSPVPTTGFAPEGAPGELFRFTVGDGDNNPPLIAHTPIANGQPSGAAIAITAGIVDNGDVESATVHFRAIGGGAFQTAALTFDTGTTWRGQIPAQAAVPPGVEYYLSAEDDGENTSTNPEGGPEVFHTFTISDIDNAGPTITHTPIGNGQPEFQAVTVAATIEDVSGIDFVKLHYRPIGLPIFQEATMAETNGVFTGSIPGFAVSSPGVEYYIRAVDLESNTSVDPETAPGTPHTFSVGSNDEDAPTLVHDPIEDGQTAGQSVAIEATVFDPSDLDSVTLSYRLEGDQDFTELAMVFTSGTTWAATIPGEDVQPEGIDYFITAVDDSPNNNTSTSPEGAPDSVHSFTVLVPDDAPPVIEHTPRAQPLTFGFDLQINADIADDSGVESAILWYGYDAEQLQPRALVEVVDGLWGTTLAGIDMPDGTSEIRYTIEATDTQDNTAELPVDGVFTVAVVTPDTTAPEVSLGDLPGSVEQGTPIEVSVTATDTQSGVATVRLFYRTVGADNFAVLATTESGGNVYTATLPGDVVLVPGVEIFAEADDIEANTANTDTVTVGVTPPPDLTPPAVSVEPIADGQPAGQAVTVLAQATDDSQPVTAALFFRAEGSNGGFTELAMGSIGDGLFSATIEGGEVQVPGVEYYVQAIDAADNSATAPAGAPGNALVFEVTPDDTSGPTIGHAVPGGPLESGLMLTIEATVLDPSDIGAVTVFWRTQGQPDFQTVTLTGNGDLFSGDIGPLAAPGIEYYIEATDGLDNTSSQPSDAPASVNTIEVRDPDLAAPTIDHTPIADGREPGLSIEVSADITDPSGVASATLFYRPIGGPAFGEAIMARSGDTWTAQIPGVVINEPGVEYYIQAIDNADAPNTGTLPDEAPQRVLAFSVGGGVIDQTPPTIDHTPIDAEQAAGTEVEISATITDDTGVAEAQVFFRGLGEDRFLAVPMEASGDVFTAAIPAFAVVAPGVEYYIEATDASPRGLVTVDPADAPDTVHGFDVPSDVPDAPVIDLQDIDSPQQAGTPLAVVATITDPDGIDRAEAFYRVDGDDAFTTIDLDNVQGDRYEAMLPGDDVLPEFIEIFVEAEDTLGNIAVEPTGDPLTIVIESEEVDQTPPTIVHSPPSGGLVGRAIELQAIVTDATGVDAVKIRFRQSGEEDFVSVDMDQDGDRWSGVIPAFAAQGSAVEYYLEAIDTSPDTNVSTDPEAAPDAVHMVELIGDNPDMDAGMGDTGDEPDAVDMPDADEPDAVDPDVVEPDNDADNGPIVPPVDPPDEEGCGCQTPASPASPVGGAFGLLALLALVVLRRR